MKRFREENTEAYQDEYRGQHRNQYSEQDRNDFRGSYYGNERSALFPIVVAITVLTCLSFGLLFWINENIWAGKNGTKTSMAQKMQKIQKTPEYYGLGEPL